MIQPDTTKMEKLKELLEKRIFHKITIVLCFIFAAICFILLISQIYSFILPEKVQINNLDQNNSNPPKSPPPKDDFFRGMPKDSPIMLLFFLLGFLINLFSGIIMYSLSNAKEKKEIKSKIVGELLLPEEQIIIDLLEKNNGELTQKELTLRSNFNKLKVSRLIGKLESLKIIDKFPYGMTNKIKLK